MYCGSDNFTFVPSECFFLTRVSQYLAIKHLGWELVDSEGTALVHHPILQPGSTDDFMFTSMPYIIVYTYTQPSTIELQPSLTAHQPIINRGFLGLHGCTGGLTGINLSKILACVHANILDEIQ